MLADLFFSIFEEPATHPQGNGDNGDAGGWDRGPRAVPALSRKLGSQEAVLCLLFSILDVKGVVTGEAHFNDDEPVVLPDSGEVVLPVPTLLVTEDGGMVNGDGVLILWEEKQDVRPVFPGCVIIR